MKSGSRIVWVLKRAAELTVGKPGPKQVPRLLVSEAGFEAIHLSKALVVQRRCAPRDIGTGAPVGVPVLQHVNHLVQNVARIIVGYIVRRIPCPLATKVVGRHKVDDFTNPPHP